MVPALETPRLRLRAWSQEDAEAGFRMYGDPQVTWFLGVTLLSVEAQRDRLRQLAERSRAWPEGQGVWAVEERESGEVVGCALLKPLGYRPGVEVGWHLARGAWGKGYATEAGRELLRHGFETLGLDRILAVVEPKNTASARVAERLGMRREGMAEHCGLDVIEFAIGPSSGS